jgi:hypothetical protein
LALTDVQITNFQTLLRSARDGDLALVECRRRRDGAIAAVLCAVGCDGDATCLTPVAEVIAGDALAMYDPPNSSGGFQQSQA